FHLSYVLCLCFHVVALRHTFFLPLLRCHFHTFFVSLHSIFLLALSSPHFLFSFFFTYFQPTPNPTLLLLTSFPSPIIPSLPSKMSQQSSRHYIHVNTTPIITGTPHVTYSSNVSPTQRSYGEPSPTDAPGPSNFLNAPQDQANGGQAQVQDGHQQNADADAGTGADANAEAGLPATILMNNMGTIHAVMANLADSWRFSPSCKDHADGDIYTGVV
ncbi:MAG: hypothetical protein J3R72DRAFT_506715, partial [Linnemannia gamsii]